MKRFFTNLMALAVVFSLSTATLNAQKVLSLADPATIDKVIEDNAKDGWDLTWSTELYNLLGNTSGQEMQWGMYNRFTPEDLETLGAVNTTLTKIKCYPYNHSTAPTQMTGLKVVVYTGGSYEGNTIDPGTLIVDQEYEWDNVFETKTIDLEEPVFIDGTQEIWIGAVYTFTSGYPAVADDGTNYQEKKGDIISMTSNGQTEWSQTKDCLASGEWPYNWYVFGYIEDGGTPPTPPAGDALINADFEIGSAGAKVAQTYIEAGYDFFTTFSELPGGAEDPIFTKDQAYEGELAVELTYGNDFIALLGDKTAGHYAIDFQMYVPTGKAGYFNLLHLFNGTSSEWACEIYINSSDNGTAMLIGGETLDFNFPLGQWNAVHFDIDLDNDAASMSINDKVIHEWQFSLNASKGLRQLAALNIYPPEANVSLAYVDNLVYSDLNAGGAIFETDFEDLSNGDYLAASYPEFWDTWSSAPGTAEDAVISKEYAASGSLSSKFVYGSDVVFLAGDKTAGSYTIKFNILVPQGKDGYFNLLHVFAGTSSEHACEIYLNSSTEGTAFKAAGINTSFDFPLGTWNAIQFDIDLDNDNAIFMVNDKVIQEWQFSINASKGLRQLAAVDFFPPTSNAVSLFYMDDFQYIGSGAQTAPVMNVDVTALNFEVEKGDTDSEEVTVSNTGTSIGDYVAWVEYETEAKGGDEHFILSYCGEYNSGVGFTTGTPVIEVASRFPFDYYSTFLGTNINQVSYYCGDYELINNTLTLRVYGQGTATTPGELLAEKTLSNYQVNYWNTVTFDAPIALDGGDIWVAAEFQQTEGSYPISFDGGTAPYNANGDFYRTNGGGWSNFANAEYGNICIRGFAEGTPVPSWVYLSGETAASLMAGTEESFNVMIDASSIEEGNYNATLVIKTNDENNPLFEIPITLNCTDVDGIVDVEGSFRMYPNPATDVITIEAESTINNIYVYNEIGQLVFNANGNGNVANISVNNLSSGIYFVRIDTANGINVSKLIVK